MPEEEMNSDELDNIVHGLGSVPMCALIKEIRKRLDVSIIYGLAWRKSDEGAFVLDLKGDPWQVRGLLCEMQEYMNRNAPIMPDVLSNEGEEVEEEDGE